MFIDYFRHRVLLNTPIGDKCIFHGDSQHWWAPILIGDMGEAKISCLTASVSLVDERGSSKDLSLVVVIFHVFLDDLMLTA